MNGNSELAISVIQRHTVKSILLMVNLVSRVLFSKDIEQLSIALHIFWGDCKMQALQIMFKIN